LFIPIDYIKWDRTSILVRY